MPFYVASVSQACDLLDKLNHLSLLDRATAILIELPEALVEVFVVESRTVAHIGECITHELLGFILVEIAIAVCVVFAPDFINAFSYHVVDFAVLGHLVSAFSLSKLKL